jgi:hypothetical protein
MQSDAVKRKLEHDLRNLFYFFIFFPLCNAETILRMPFQCFNKTKKQEHANTAEGSAYGFTADTYAKAPRNQVVVQENIKKSGLRQVNGRSSKTTGSRD